LTEIGTTWVPAAHVGEPGGGAYRPYDALMAEFVPALRVAELSEAENGSGWTDPGKACRGARDGSWASPEGR
jgi:hypothetical protein